MSGDRFDLSRRRYRFITNWKPSATTASPQSWISVGISPSATFGSSAEHIIGVPMASDGQVLGAVLVQSYQAAVHYSDDDRL